MIHGIDVAISQTLRIAAFVLEALERFVFGIEKIQAVRGADPQALGVVFEHNANMIVAQAVGVIGIVLKT